MTDAMTEAPDATSARGAEPQPRELIVTLFGLYARREHNWLSVASIVRMMDALGVEGPAVRSSISRLKRRGTLVSSRHRGSVGYALSDSLLSIITEGDTRIFGRRRATTDEGFLLLAFSVPESERDKRHALRSTLIQLGFGTVSPGVWIAPSHLEHEAVEALGRRHLIGYVELFRGHRVGSGSLSEKVAQWWDLQTLETLYANFITTYGPLRDANLDERQTFAQYVQMLTSWRRLPYLDPGLPLELLPDDWHGVIAEELFQELHRDLGPAAREYAAALIHPSAT